ncbi:rhomboid family intramembrane serine protease [Marmoricola endophyticus]|nr:rhomboid family intramembrane serine protease [Marmoricola endophyticus]
MSQSWRPTVTRQRREPARRQWGPAAAWTLGFVALLWVLEVIDQTTRGSLDSLGIVPRSESGLVGIVFAPLLHAGFGHLEGNTIPVVVLGFAVLLSGLVRGLVVTAVIWLVGGFGVWLFSPTYSVTIGASILIFGWLVYLILRGFFTRRVGEIVFGVVVLLVYGGLLVGVLPGQPGVSWQGHLFGGLGGALAAVWIGRRSDRDLALR